MGPFLYFSGRVVWWSGGRVVSGLVAFEIENNANSAFNQVVVEVKAELGKKKKMFRNLEL